MDRYQQHLKICILLTSKLFFSLSCCRISDNTILSSKKPSIQLPAFLPAEYRWKMGNKATTQGWKRAEEEFLGKKKQKKLKVLVLMSFDMAHSHPDSLPSVPSTVQCPQCLFGLGFNV